MRTAEESQNLETNESQPLNNGEPGSGTSNNDKLESEAPNNNKTESKIPDIDKQESKLQNNNKTGKHENPKIEKSKSDKPKKDKPSVLNQFWILFPFFLLHMGAGLAGGFTSVLMQHFQHLDHSSNVSKEQNASLCHDPNTSTTWMGVQLVGDGAHCSEKDGDSSFMIILATAEDYAPIIVSILSGFLQQLLGPRRILQITALPATLSWILVIINPESEVLVIFSRFMAGLANGLLSSNVYAADISHRENRQTLKMIEGASRSAGFILIYVLQLIFWNCGENIRWISGIASLLPLFSFIGMFFRPESSVFTARDTIKRTTKKLKSEKRLKINAQKTPTEVRPKSVNRKTGNMRFPPLGSPTIYRPLIFISCIICLQHCSGFAFTKKFLLQLLKPEDPSSDPRMATIFAIAITTIRLFANLFMARLLKTIRVRGLFFFSLFATSSCLIILGVFMDDCLELSPITGDARKYIKVVLLALHVFLVQFGLQNLSGNLTDILFPTMYKAVMKGVLRAITSITLVFFLFALTFNVSCVIKYSWTFWIMGCILILASPVLWVFIPEVRNIGKKMASEFYRSNQTVFFLVIQKKGREKEIESAFDPDIERKSTRFKEAVEKIIETNKITREVISVPKLFRALSDFGTNMHQLSKLIAEQEAIEENADDAQTVTFQTTFGTAEEMLNDKLGQDDNKERVCYIDNIHPQGGFLLRNKNDERVLIAKGPVKLEDSFALTKGGLFVFNDVVIISQCIRSNCRYIKEKVFQVSDETFQITRDQTKITFSDSTKNISVTCEETTEAKIWEKYINHYKNDAI